MIRFPVFSAVVLLMAGCAAAGEPAAPAPAAPAGTEEARAPAAPPVPAPAAEEPAARPAEGVPHLLVEPGSTHRFRHTMKMAMEFVGNEMMPSMGMELATEATHRILEPSAKGESRVEIRVERSRAVIEVESLGLRMELDSTRPEQWKALAAGGDGPGAAFSRIFGSVGRPQVWVLHGDGKPEKEASPGDGGGEEIGEGAEADGDGDGEAEAGDGETCGDDACGCGDGGGDGMEVLLPIVWLDLLPDRALRSGEKGDEKGNLPPLLGLPGRLEKIHWEVVGIDPGSGVADLAVTGSGLKRKGEEGEGDPEGLDLDLDTVEIRDRFDARASRYLSRVIRLEGHGTGAAPMGGEDGPGEVRMHAEIGAERVESFDPPAGAPAK